MRRLAFVMAVLAACGEDGGGPLSVDDLPGAFQNAYCSALVRCGVISDVATCRGLDLDEGDVDPELEAAVDNGTVIFNETEARLCIAAIGTTCEGERIFDNNEHCDLAFEGTVAAGGACSIGEQCLSGQCDILVCQEACCPGMCIGDPEPDRPRLGDPCAGSFDGCLDSYCDDVSMQCEAFKNTGQSCTGDFECAQGYCNGVCTTLPGEGEACLPDSESSCDSIGLYCHPTTAVCTKYALEGETCGATAQCSPVYECNGSTCELGSRLGDACNPQERECLDSSYCHPTTLRCTAPSPDGAPCESSTQCIGDCDFDTMTCVSDPICI